MSNKIEKLKKTEYQKPLIFTLSNLETSGKITSTAEGFNNMGQAMVMRGPGS